MKKLKLLLPTAALFASPWMHKLIYNNFLLAWPEMEHGTAHFFAIFGAIGVFVVTALMAGDL